MWCWSIYFNLSGKEFYLSNLKTLVARKTKKRRDVNIDLMNNECRDVFYRFLDFRMLFVYNKKNLQKLKTI